MSGDTLIGIDAGLTNVTVAAFDRSGTATATATVKTPGRSPAPGRDEQDQDALWAATVDAISRVLANDAVDPSGIRGIGVAGHGHGLYALDREGDPVVGVKSTDDRATRLRSEWEADGTLERVTDRLGWEPFGADPYSLLSWFDRQQPAVAERIDTVLFCKDVLTYRLTGERTTDPMDGSALVPPDGNVEPVLTILGLDAYEAVLPDVVESTAIAGTVTADAATDTGLPVGVPVAAGLQDVGACALGAGAVESGQGTIILGTWGQSVAVTDHPETGTTGLPRRYLDRWIRYRGIRAGAAGLDWFVEELGAQWRAEASERDIDPYEVYEERAAAVPPGANGVIFHPYLNGSTDEPGARGGFYGCGLDTTREELLRAVYEGVAAALTLGIADMNVPISDLRLSGGGARSRLWGDILADCTDESVTVPAGEEMGARGAAICAGVAVDMYATIADAVEETITIERRHEPDATRVEQYRTVLEAFEQAREGLTPAWRTLMSVSAERTNR